jgi:hypothetical protein
MADAPFTADNLDFGPVLYTEAQARNFATYQRLKSEAARRGVELREVSESEMSAATGQAAPEKAEPPGEHVHMDATGKKWLVVPSATIADHAAYLAAQAKAHERDMELWIVAD